MTHDEIRTVIAYAARTCELPIGGGFDATGHLTDRDCDELADAVMTALRDAGLVIGEMAKLANDENEFWNDVFRDCDESHQFLECFDASDGTLGLALVRVVTTDE